MATAHGWPANQCFGSRGKSNMRFPWLSAHWRDSAPLAPFHKGRSASSAFTNQHKGSPEIGMAPDRILAPE
jgi:hypothetical protein